MEKAPPLLPLYDSNSARVFILVAFRVASSHPCRPVIGEYLLSCHSVGTHLELTYGEYFVRHGEYCP